MASFITCWGVIALSTYFFVAPSWSAVGSDKFSIFFVFISSLFPISTLLNFDVPDITFKSLSKVTSPFTNKVFDISNSSIYLFMSPISNNVLILDEPFKHLKGETANLRVLDMVQQISKKLNLQIIMVSDERISRDDIEEKADRLFLVELKNKVSQVTVIK